MPLLPLPPVAPMEQNNNNIVVAATGERQLRGLKLLSGSRWLPTDEELLTFYLRKRVAGRTLHPRIHIPTVDLYAAGADPWVVQCAVGFPYGEGSEFYCFTFRSRRGSGVVRTAGLGTGAAKGKDMPIKAVHSGELVCHRLMLKFVPNDGGSVGGDESANWIMHKYQLPDHGGAKGKGGDEAESSDGGGGGSVRRRRRALA